MTASAKALSKKSEASNDVVVYDPKQIATLRNSLYPGAKEESVIMVLDYCHHAGYDVMLKPVHIVPMWIVDKETGNGAMRDVIMPGINMYRIIASRSGCAGIGEPVFGPNMIECIGGVDMIFPEWCVLTVRRIVGGQIVEYTAKEYWKENYANSGKDKTTNKIKLQPNAMWTKRPYGQLAKCTEAQALRKGFPEIGAMPTAEEMEGKHLDSDEYQTLITKPNKGVNGLKSKLGMVKDAPTKDEEETLDYDPETGELVEDAEFDEVEEAQSAAPASESSGGMSASTMIFLIESASDKKELMDSMKHLKELTNKKDKEAVYAAYKKKEAEFKG